MGDKKIESAPGGRGVNDRRQPFGDVPLARRHALVMVRDALEREGIRTLLTGWGCESIGAASLQEVVQELLPRPDLLVVGGSRQTEESGAAHIANLRALYAARVPAILIGEANPSAAETNTPDYTLLAPLFAPSQLRAALVALLEREPSRA